MTDYGKTIKDWDTGKKEWDITKEFARLNPDLVNGFGQDRYSYRPELTHLNALYWHEVEAKQSHGYPRTAWL